MVKGLRVIIKKGEWGGVEVLGAPLREHLIERLVSEGCDAVFSENGFSGEGNTAVIYDDMPLVDARFLSEIFEKLKDSGLEKAKIGDGFCGLGNSGREVEGLEIDDERTLRVRDELTLSAAFDALRARIAADNMKKGVRILGADGVCIELRAKIEAGAQIGAGAVIKGQSVIERGVKISGQSTLDGAVVRAGATIKSSVIENSSIGAGTSVGPNAYIRAGSEIGDGCRIGDFVEIKNSVLKNGVKCAHLTYVGDAEVGEGVNLGCGVVFANYNGRLKQRTVVGDGAFIGSNTNLVAPLNVGNNAYIAAGSTITEDVPEAAFAIARERQIIKENYSIFGR